MTETCFHCPAFGHRWDDLVTRRAFRFLSNSHSLTLFLLVLCCSTWSYGCCCALRLPRRFFVFAFTLATLFFLYRFQRPSDGDAEQKVVEYAFKALDALGVKFGPTHTGITGTSV